MVPSHNLLDRWDVPPGLHNRLARADFDPPSEVPTSSDGEELVPVYNTLPEPHVQWYSPGRFESKFGYRPGDVASTVKPEVLREYRRERRLRLIEPRMVAFERIAQLWNGESVGPNDVHLLADKVPPWSDVVEDIEQHYLEPLLPTVRQMDPELVDAFSEYDWFESQVVDTAWLKPKYIVRKRADYDLEECARTLINGREDLPSLKGDPHEGLPHRFGVGLETLRARFVEGHPRVETYYPMDGYTVDLLEFGEDGTRYVGEVITNHNNTTLYRNTYTKLVELGHPAVLVFDSRETIRRVFNHWATSNLGADVPGAPFTSVPRMEWLKQKCRDAAVDPAREWPVRDVFTLTSLWHEVFESGRPPSRRKVVSADW